jgi:hypothetical protein
MLIMRTNSRLLIFTLILIAATTVCKYYLGPELSWSGFSPVIAISLFSGMLISDKSKSFFLPLIAVFASDVIIHGLYLLKEFDYPGFYTWQLFNYSLLLAITLIGWALKGKNYGTIAVGGIIAPTAFFLFSNFGSWMIDYGNLYTEDLNGLMASYRNGLPFYKNALGATLVFLPAIMLCYNFLVKRTAAMKLV